MVISRLPLFRDYQYPGHGKEPSTLDWLQHLEGYVHSVRKRAGYSGSRYGGGRVEVKEGSMWDETTSAPDLIAICERILMNEMGEEYPAFKKLCAEQGYDFALVVADDVGDVDYSSFTGSYTGSLNGFIESDGFVQVGPLGAGVYARLRL